MAYLLCESASDNMASPTGFIPFTVLGAVAERSVVST